MAGANTGDLTALQDTEQRLYRCVLAINDLCDELEKDDAKPAEIERMLGEYVGALGSVEQAAGALGDDVSLPEGLAEAIAEGKSPEEWARALVAEVEAAEARERTEETYLADLSRLLGPSEQSGGPG